MDDAFDTGGDSLDLSVVGKVGRDKLLIAPKILRFADVAETNARIGSFEQFAEPRANVASCTGNQNCLHHILLRELLRANLFRAPLRASGSADGC